MQFASLTNIGNGLAVKQFDREFSRVLSDIADESKPALSKRKIVLEIDIFPDELRNVGDIEIRAKSSLAPVKARKALIYFTKIENGIRATINDPQQEELVFDLQRAQDKIAGGEK